MDDGVAGTAATTGSALVASSWDCAKGLIVLGAVGLALTHSVDGDGAGSGSVANVRVGQDDNGGCVVGIFREGDGAVAQCGQGESGDESEAKGANFAVFRVTGR